MNTEESELREFLKNKTIYDIELDDDDHCLKIIFSDETSIEIMSVDVYLNWMIL